MKKCLIVAFISLLEWLLLLPPAQAAPAWALAKDSSGIKVYARPVPGTELMEYMGVTAVDGKIEVIGEVLRDVASYKEWMADCYHAQVIKKYDRNTMVIYMVLRPPLIETRDLVLKDKAVYDWDNARANVSFLCTDDAKIPLAKGRTRVTVMNGVFEMEYLGRNKTKFVYYLKVDPAGDIPKKLAYSVMKNYPYNTLKGLRKMVSNGKYAALAKGTDEEKQIDTRVLRVDYVRRVLSNRLAKFVKNKASLMAIVAAENDGIKAIMDSGGSYASMEKTSISVYRKYIDSIVADKGMAEKLKNDQKLIGEITDMIVSDCGAVDVMVDNIIASHSAKYGG